MVVSVPRKFCLVGKKLIVKTAKSQLLVDSYDGPRAGNVGIETFLRRLVG